jgi:hypothetical protein
VLEPDGSFSVLQRVDGGRTSALEDVPEFGDLFNSSAAPQHS